MQLALKIDAPEDILPTFGYTRDGGHAHIEINNGNRVYYVAIERGQEVYRFEPQSMDELLYKVFENAAWVIAGEYELKNRIAGQDFRRMLFKEQERLIGILNENWELELNKKHQAILIKHPFDDHGSERATYTAQLRASGETPNDAWDIACKKYPLPHQ